MKNLNSQKRIAMITSLLPEGHYSQILCNALHTHTDCEIHVVTDDRKENLHVKRCGTIHPAWRKGVLFGFDVLREIRTIKPDVVHFQHEFNIYGGIASSCIFPFVILLLRLMGYSVIVTLHAVIAPEQIIENFMQLFFIHRSILIRPMTLRLFFYFFYLLTSRFATITICHTELMKRTMNKKYFAPENRVKCIEPVVPQKQIQNLKKKSQFLYYGYIVRRKGLEDMLRGFAAFTRSYPEFQLVVAGGVIAGQEEALNEIKKIILQLGITSNVTLYGFVRTEEELSRLYAESLAVIIPATLSIAASGPLYHARGYHSVILASDTGNLGEEVRKGNDGLRVQLHEWEDAMSQIAKDNKLRDALKQRSEASSTFFSPANIATRYNTLYDSIIG